MEFLWGGILLVLIIVVLWASRDRGSKEEAELEGQKDEESWTLDSVEDTSGPAETQ